MITKALIRKIFSSIPSRQKARLINFALSHLGELPSEQKAHLINFVLSHIGELPSQQKMRLVDLALSHTVFPEVSYFRLAAHGFRPNGIVDVGAYHGDWSRSISKIYPNVPLLMIEAQTSKRPRLEHACAQLSNARFELCLLGDKEGAEAVFYVMELGSTLYNERSNMPRTRQTLTMHTLDNVLTKHPQLKPPLFIKLDVQGAELDVLAGGSRTLALTEVAQLEIALMNYNEGAPQINSVLKFMNERGFSFFDISGFLKPDSKYLAQIDVLFVRNESTLRTDYWDLLPKA
jgi:FkbM family methyltransferase